MCAKKYPRVVPAQINEQQRRGITWKSAVNQASLLSRRFPLCQNLSHLLRYSGHSQCFYTAAPTDCQHRSLALGADSQDSFTSIVEQPPPVELLMGPWHKRMWEDRWSSRPPLQWRPEGSGFSTIFPLWAADITGWQKSVWGAASRCKWNRDNEWRFDKVAVEAEPNKVILQTWSSTFVALPDDRWRAIFSLTLLVGSLHLENSRTGCVG